MEEDLAWAAGYFDGDGTFSNAGAYAHVALAGTDLELLERFQRVVGIGNINGPYDRRHPRRWSKSPLYSFNAYRGARAIAEQLWPYLGDAKRAQAERLEATRTWSELAPLALASGPILSLGRRSRLGLAWAAGFFDAEGCFSYNLRSGGCVSITQTDKELFERFASIVDLGSIYGPYTSADRTFVRKPHYLYRASGLERVQALAAMMWFRLGAAKKRQAEATLDPLRTTVCHRGHPKKPGHAGCGQCTKEYWRARREGRGGSTAEAAPLYLTA